VRRRATAVVLAFAASCWNTKTRVVYVYVDRIVREHDHVACFTVYNQVPAYMTTPCDGMSEDECHRVHDEDLAYHWRRLVFWANDAYARCHDHED
jgi:hypothetical protein